MDNLLCLDQWKFTACCSPDHKIQEQLTRCAQAMGNNQGQKVISNNRCEFSVAQELLDIVQSRRQQRPTRVVWSEKCRGLRGTAWHKMQVIAGFFGSGARAALPVHGTAFSTYFKKLAQFAKLATS